MIHIKYYQIQGRDIDWWLKVDYDKYEIVEIGIQTYPVKRWKFEHTKYKKLKDVNGHVRNTETSNAIVFNEISSEYLKYVTSTLFDND